MKKILINNNIKIKHKIKSTYIGINMFMTDQNIYTFVSVIGA